MNMISLALSNAKRNVCILRGLPGSGKTYISEKIQTARKQKNRETVIVSLDSNFVTSDGKYEFLEEKEMEYLERDLDKYRSAITEEKEFIIVDNINVNLDDFVDFYDIAKASNYNVFIVEVACPNVDNDYLASRSVHDWSPESIGRMKADWASLTLDDHRQFQSLPVGSLTELDNEDVEMDVEMDAESEDDMKSIEETKAPSELTKPERKRKSRFSDIPVEEKETTECNDILKNDGNFMERFLKLQEQKKIEEKIQEITKKQEKLKEEDELVVGKEDSDSEQEQYDPHMLSMDMPKDTELPHSPDIQDSPSPNPSPGKEKKKETKLETIRRLDELKQKIAETVNGTLSPYFKSGKIKDKSEYKKIVRAITKKIYSREKGKAFNSKIHKKIKIFSKQYIRKRLR